MKLWSTKLPYCKRYEDSVKLCKSRIVRSVHLVVGCGWLFAACPSAGRGVVRRSRVIDGGGRCAGAGNSGIVKTGARTRVFRAATQRAICARSPQTDNIACARAAPVTISHFEISVRLQRTLLGRAAGRSIYASSCLIPVVTWNLRLEWKRWPRRGYRPTITLTVRPMRWFCVCFSSVDYDWMQFFVWRGVGHSPELFLELLVHCLSVCGGGARDNVACGWPTSGPGLHKVCADISKFHPWTWSRPGVVKHAPITSTAIVHVFVNLRYVFDYNRPFANWVDIECHRDRLSRSVLLYYLGCGELSNKGFLYYVIWLTVVEKTDTTGCTRLE